MNSRNGVAVGFGHAGKAVAGALRLAAMPQDRLGQVAGAAVMQELGPARNGSGSARSPTGRGAPFAA